LKQLKEILLYPFSTLQNLTLINKRIFEIRKLISQLNLDEIDLYFIGRSAGAIVASKLSFEYPIKALIALGYPFFHPTNGRQSYRIKHLKRINCPMFIFQGVNDIYGKPEQIGLIPLSPNVQIIPIETDHDFNLDEATWRLFCLQLTSIINQN
jgi:predicted alpha/beta-hydrolase family hydrolase